MGKIITRIELHPLSDSNRRKMKDIKNEESKIPKKYLQFIAVSNFSNLNNPASNFANY
jgi:hypothetical protein